MKDSGRVVYLVTEHGNSREFNEITNENVCIKYGKCNGTQYIKVLDIIEEKYPDATNCEDCSYAECGERESILKRNLRQTIQYELRDKNRIELFRKSQKLKKKMMWILTIISAIETAILLIVLFLIQH